MFSCEFYKISKNTFSYRTPPVATSVPKSKTAKKKILINKEKLFNNVAGLRAQKDCVYLMLPSFKTSVT